MKIVDEIPVKFTKILKINTTDESVLGHEGVICLSGPAVMLGYLH